MKKAPLKVGVTPRPVEKILPLPAFKLSLEERVALRGIYESEVFRKAWHNAKLSAPGAFPAGDLTAPNGGVIALNRINQQQGWQLFEAALLKQINDPTPARQPIPESFPDSGLEIVDPRKLPQPPPPPPAPLYVEPKKKR